MTTRQHIFWFATVLLALAFIYAIQSVLLPFVLGMLTAYFLDPAADRLQRFRLSRTAATSVITACFFIAVGMVLLFVVPIIARQFAGLMESLPGYAGELEARYRPTFSGWLGGLPAEQMESIKSAAANISGVMAKWLADVIAGLFQSGMALINVLSLILITPVVTFYLLRDWDEITERVDRLLPRKHAQTIREQLAIIDGTLAGFLRGQLNVCLVLALYYALTLSLAGLKFGIVIGFATGLFAIVPYVGFMAGMATGVAVAFFQFGWGGHMIAVLIIFAVGQLLESYALTPKLVGEKVGLHPVWIIFGMLVGGALFGFVGVLLAIPITAIIGVLTRFALARYEQSAYYHGS